MTNHDFSGALASVPNPDQYTHGNRIMVEFTFDELRSIRAALTIAQQLQYGTHVVVPVEPTEAMYHAGQNYISNALEHGRIAGVDDVYRAMIAAAKTEGV